MGRGHSPGMHVAPARGGDGVVGIADQGVRAHDAIMSLSLILACFILGNIASSFSQYPCAQERNGGGSDLLLSTQVEEAQYDILDFSQPTQACDDMSPWVPPPRVSVKD